MTTKTSNPEEVKTEGKEAKPKTTATKEEAKPEIEKVEEVKANSTKEVKTEEEEKKEEKKEIKATKETAANQESKVLELKKPTALYTSPNDNFPQIQVIGNVSVINSTDKYDEITATLHGFGKVTGFIKK